jgi:DNA invertase Pin-like site-specific DNA recombinase
METRVIGRIESNITLSSTRIRYCLYCRKSTTDDDSQALSIESQVKEMTTLAERLNLNIVSIKRESHSAKDSGQRPVFRELIEEVKNGKYNGILAWDVSRISRNVIELSEVVNLMEEKRLLHIQTNGQAFTNSPNEKFLLMILGSQAKFENDNKSINVKRGLKARVEMGLWPCRPPTGYTRFKRMDQKCESVIDKERAPIIKQVFEKIGYDGWSGRKVYNWLHDDIKFKTEANKFLSLGNFYELLKNDFYYGRFEYPRGSGHWYNGAHEPIITKDLYDLVQENIKSQILLPKSEQKEFAFTKLMTCGECGSGITAEEKFKHQKNGNTHRYIYYKCTRKKDENCKNPVINEDDLVDQLKQLIDDLDIRVLPMKEKISNEVKRFKLFQQTLLGTKSQIAVKDIDIRNYAKFILQEGNIDEKREFFRCLNSDILLKNKTIKLA